MSRKEMSRKELWKSSLVILVVFGLIVALVPTGLWAAPPRGGRPAHARPHGAPHARPPVKAHAHPAVKAHPYPGPAVKAHRAPVGGPPRVHARVLPPPRYRAVVPWVVPRVVVGDGAVVVDSGTTVIQESTPTAATSSVEDTVVATDEDDEVPAEAYQVVRVADDYTVTILVDGQQTAVRLLGVEPPLVAANQGGPGVLPEAARHFVRNLLVAESVYLDYDPAVAQRDAEGTLVAYLHRAPDGLLINEELIRQGYAQAATGYQFEYQPQFASYQRKAQADGKGVWPARSAGPE